jgi:hypothetical protein
MDFLSTFRYIIVEQLVIDFRLLIFYFILGNGFATTEKNHEEASRNSEPAL